MFATFETSTVYSNIAVWYSHFFFVGCNTSLNGTRGTFHSPNYPAKYPDGQYCSWRITVSPAQRIHLVFTTFSLQNESNTDALYVYDGKNEEGKELGVFYGKHPPPTRGIYSSSNQIFVMFISDSSVSYTGFNASYCDNQCPGKWCPGCERFHGAGVGWGGGGVIIKLGWELTFVLASKSGPALCTKYVKLLREVPCLVNDFR